MKLQLNPAHTAPPFTIPQCREKKQRGEKIVCLTVYDHPSARLLDQAGVDLALVGDSLGMTLGGYDSTLPVTLDEMTIATRWVRRGLERALLVTDLPYGSYQLGWKQTVRSGLQLVRQGGAAAVKLEGGGRKARLVEALVEAEIPVMGHLGLTPQALHRMGGYKVQALDTESAENLLADAQALEAAGAFAVVLEGVPRELAGAVTRALRIPTIGIGAGPDCDGQILVWHDALGLSFGPTPRFVRAFADLNAVISPALSAYAREVRAGTFPADAESYHRRPAQRLAAAR